MENKYFKLDFNQAVSAKKDLLSSQIGLINVIKRINQYKLLRKKERVIKSQLRMSLEILREKINLMQSTLPEKNFNEKKPKIMKTLSKEIKKSRNLQDELDDIKAKLARLE